MLSDQQSARIESKIDTLIDGNARLDERVASLQSDFAQHLAGHASRDKATTEKWRDFRDTGFKGIAAVGGVGGIVAYLRLFVFGGN